MTSETPQTTLLLELSQEELSVLLRFMGIPRTWSFETRTLSDEIFEVVGRGLLARGLLTEENGQFNVPDEVTALLGSGSFSRYALRIQKVVGTNAPMEFWLYLSPGLTVSHVITPDAVHHFQTIPNGLTLTLLLAAFLEFNLKEDVAENSQSIVIPATVWREAMDAVKAGKRSTARDHLLRHNVSPVFSNDVEMYTRLHLLAYSVLAADGTSQVTGGLILTTAAGHWIVSPQGERMMAVSLSAQGILDQIAELIADQTAGYQR